MDMEAYVRDSEITPLGWDYLQDLATVVQRIHYPRSNQAEDLISLAVLKGATLLLDDREQGAYRSLRSYLYTGMRNEMSNFLYHLYKYKSILPEESLVVEYEEDHDIENSVYEILNSLPFQVGKDSARYLLVCLLSGLPIGGIDVPNGKEAEKLIVLTLWELRRVIERWER